MRGLAAPVDLPPTTHTSVLAWEGYVVVVVVVEAAARGFCQRERLLTLLQPPPRLPPLPLWGAPCGAILPSPLVRGEAAAAGLLAALILRVRVKARHSPPRLPLPSTAPPLTRLLMTCFRSVPPTPLRKT